MKRYCIDPHRYKMYPHNFVWLDYFSLRQCQNDFDIDTVLAAIGRIKLGVVFTLLVRRGTVVV